MRGIVRREGARCRRTPSTRTGRRAGAARPRPRRARARLHPCRAAPAAAGERFKATAYILGRELRADGVRVTIFRQVLQSGRWVDAPVAQSTVGEIENKVLARARELRTQSTRG